MNPEEQAAAVAALDLVSEFRFVYWHTDVEKPSSYKVRRDWENRSDRWGIFEGDVLVWTGESWEPLGAVPDAFRWELPEALKVAQELAREENAYRIAIMEQKFPGQFKGGPWDMSSELWTGRGSRGAIAPSNAPSDPPRNMAEFAQLQRMRLGQKIAANEMIDRGEKDGS